MPYSAYHRSVQITILIRNSSVSAHNPFLAKSGQLSNFLRPSNNRPIWQRELLELNHMVLTGTSEPSRLITGT